MKIGGLGAVDSISRFDQMKPAKGENDAKASSSPLAALSSASPSSKPDSVSKRAPRSSNVSNENAKDFSTVLGEASKAPKKEVSAVSSKESEKESNDGTNEALAGSSAVAGSQVKATPDRRAPVADEPRSELKEVSRAGVKPSDVKAETKNSGLTTETDESVSAILEDLEDTVDTESSMRQLSMSDFLGKMKSEFGIEPEAIVKAFAQLDATALQAPPEQTAEAVLGQLGLKPEQMPKAASFYREMLTQTGESALNESMAGVAAGVSLDVLSEQDVAMDRLQKSILSLNDAFARRDAAAEPVSPEMLAMMSGVNATEAQAAAQVSAQATQSAMAAPLSPLEMALADSAQDDSVEALAIPDADAKVDKSADKKSESKFASLGAVLSAASAGAASVANSAANGGGSNSQSNQDPKSTKTEAPKPREFNSIESALASSGFNVPPVGEKAAVPLAAGTSTAAALASALGNQGTDGPTNAQELVRNAQVLAKAGGGEMKMQLKPEGIGDVTLKVQVKDGQVAIQMMTENDSAKKLLESNLDDLKTSLAQHKLHVDALKIEVGGEMTKQRFEQAQQDSNREQARQMAQDFMGQFRQDREGFRGGVFDQSGFKNYQQPKRNPLPEIEPVVTSSVSSQKTSGERRLNLVA